MFQEEGTEHLTQEQIKEKNKTAVAKLHKIITPFMMRRTKKNALRDLPPKKQIYLYVGLTDL